MSKQTDPAAISTVHLESAKMFKDAEGKLYRKLTATDAVKSPNLVRGTVGTGDKEKAGFFEPVTVA